MQFANPLAGGSPPSGGGAASIDDQLKAQQLRHRRIFMRRTFAQWWLPVVLVIFSGLLTYFELGPLAIDYPVEVYAVLAAIPLAFFCIWRLEFGFFLMAISATALFPHLATVKSADLYPSVVLMVVIFGVLVVQVAYHKREVFLPSLWSTWPQVCLLILAVISTMMIQATWTHGVPHKINSNPIIEDEIFGVLLFAFPLMTYIVISMMVSKNESLLRYIQGAYLIIALIISLAVFYDFRRIGGDIYTFRFSEPRILWMNLRAIAQFCVLGALLAYARFLYATSWRKRMGYLTVTLICAACVILTLENSWWLELIVGLAAMTLIYSWRFTIFCGFLSLPCIPLILSELKKLQAVKSDDTLRLVIWQDALRVWSKQPWLGVGPGDFWEYDQIFTNLPRSVRDCNATGLCVAHNGFLQALGEMGPLGLLLWIAFPLTIVVIAAILYRRSYVPRKTRHTNVFQVVAHWIGMDLYVDDLPAKKPGTERKGRKLLERLDDFARVAPPSFGRKIVRAVIVILTDETSDRLSDRILALVCIGLALGSMAGDFTAGALFIPPRQINALEQIPAVMTSWVIWGLLMYRDQVWRVARRKEKLKGFRAKATTIKGANV